MKTIWTNDEDDLRDDVWDWVQGRYDEYVAEWTPDEDEDEEEPMSFDDWIDDHPYAFDDEWEGMWDCVQDNLHYGVLPSIFKQANFDYIIGIPDNRNDEYRVWTDKDNMAEYIQRLAEGRHSYYHREQPTSITVYADDAVYLNNYRLFTFPESERHMYKFIKKLTSYLDEDIFTDYEHYRRDGESNKSYAVRSYLNDMFDDENEQYFITAGRKELKDSGILVPITDWT